MNDNSSNGIQFQLIGHFKVENNNKVWDGPIVQGTEEIPEWFKTSYLNKAKSPKKTSPTKIKPSKKKPK